MTDLADTLAFNIHCIDIDYIRPRLACSYLMLHEGRAAFIDCGTSHSVPRLISALNECGLDTSDVGYVIPTHIHLDHAGGAGALMQALPNATLVVHPRGAPHMIDPQRLVDSAKQVYGAEKFDTLYGKILPITESRVHIANDNDVIDLNGRKLLIADTPGHARHHFCIYDEMSQGWFTGDTFGLSYPDISITKGSYIFPTTTPVQFEPDAWLLSIEKLLTKKPERMFLTHYGMVEDIQTLAIKLKDDLTKYTKLALTNQQYESRVEKLKHELIEFTLKDLANLGCKQDKNQLTKLIETDITLNAQGLDIWLNRQERS